MHEERTPAEMTRDEVLLWLNDRLGKSVDVSIEVEKGDYAVTVLEAAGELRHWREDASESSEGTPRDDLMGMYVVGMAHFDLSDLDGFNAWLRVWDDTVDVGLDENVTLRIVEQADEDE